MERAADRCALQEGPVCVHVELGRSMRERFAASQPITVSSTSRSSGNYCYKLAQRLILRYGRFGNDSEGERVQTGGEVVRVGVGRGRQVGGGVLALAALVDEARV